MDGDLSDWWTVESEEGCVYLDAKSKNGDIQLSTCEDAPPEVESMTGKSCLDSGKKRGNNRLMLCSFRRRFLWGVSCRNHGESNSNDDAYNVDWVYLQNYVKDLRLYKKGWCRW